MEMCQDTHVWKPIYDLLGIRRPIQKNDILSKSGLIYFLIILGLYALVPLVGFIVQKDGGSILWPVDVIVAAIAFHFFHQLGEKRKRFLAGIRIFKGKNTGGLYDLRKLMGATFVDSPEEADFVIRKAKDGYNIYEGQATWAYFFVRVTNYDHSDIVTADIASAIYTLWKQYH